MRQSRPHLGGALIGLPILDPLVGLLIDVAIIGITWDAARRVWFRMMDAVDPALTERVRARLREHGEVRSINRLHLRWVGHRLSATLSLAVAADLTLAERDELRRHIAHHLEHDLANLGDVVIEITGG